MRIAVIGASGLVGATLVERLLTHPGCSVVPFIHSSGNAWRLARLGIELHQLDLLDAGQVHARLAGCTHIVNCSRGNSEVMLKGLKHLLSASARAHARKFVHLSSVMVYGDPPHPDSMREDAPTDPAKGTYGWVKLQQDKLVQAAAREGLPCTVLCPPNISGPHSHYLLQVLSAAMNQTLGLVDEGRGCCSLVDVENLCHAIELALEHAHGDGNRSFVTDDDRICWADLLHELAPLLPEGSIERLPRVSAAALSVSQQTTGVSVGRSIKHLVSSDMRAALRKDPLWAMVDAGLRRSVTWLGSSLENRMKLAIEGPLAVPKPKRAPEINRQLSAHQLRGIRHSNERIKSVLGYQPLHSFAESMAAFRAWYRRHRGMEGEYADLLAQLA